MYRFDIEKAFIGYYVNIFDENVSKTVAIHSLSSFTVDGAIKKAKRYADNLSPTLVETVWYERSNIDRS